MRKLSWCLGGVLFAGAALGNAPPARAVEPAKPGETPERLRAVLQPERATVLAGRPVWALLTLVNLTAEPQTLEVPDAELGADAPPQMGLPLAHVFSGKRFSGVTVKDEHGAVFGEAFSCKPRGAVPPVTLAPHGCAGLRVELSRYYEALSRPGTYELVWRPYHGVVESSPCRVTVLAEQQATITTDFGPITMRFYYDEAPNHVQDFLELIRDGFYENLKFHRVIQGGLIQGGDPRGDGRGIRPDAKRLKAEFSRVPFEAGTMGMARSPGDPDSASCQFFICLSRQPSFDRQQTAVAHVVGEESFETLRQIAAVPTTGPKYRPTQPVYIRAVSLENVPKRERVVVPQGVSDRSGAGRGETKPGRLNRLLPPPTGRRPDQPGMPVAHRTGSTSQPAADRPQ